MRPVTRSGWVAAKKADNAPPSDSPKSTALPEPIASRTARAQIVATSNDPYMTDDRVHLAYQEHNRRRYRMPGQNRIRIRYRELADPWFDYLIVSPAEMEQLVDGTEWRVRRLVRDDGSYYVAVLE
jgi:hypothetical protein